MLRRFFGDVLPPVGCYCLTLLPSGQHIWADSLDELTDTTQQYLKRSGLYFGTAAFHSFANRKQSNVSSLKALRLDIDAGPEKLAKHGEGAVYATQREALQGCVEFFRAAGLPPTYVISSGAGLHVYFCLDQATDPATWLGLSRALSAAGKRHGLKIDPSVTEDSARILRVPGAMHPNGRTVEVLQRLDKFYTVDELRRVLAAAAPEASELSAPTQRVFDTSINDDLITTYQGPPSSALKIAQHCGALREVAESRGDVQEPFWRAMIGLVKRTTEGLGIAHEWSSGYDGYDPDEVDRKFEAWTTGPTTCKEFARHSSACASCPHNGKIKSPINLGLMTAQEIEQLPEDEQSILALPTPAAATGNPWDGNLPPGFSVERLKSGQLALVMAERIERESETGEKVPAIVHIPFTHNIFWFSQWAEASNSDDSAVVTLHLYAGNYLKRYTMDQGAIASQNKLLEFLASKAIHTTSHKKAANAMQAYAKAQLQHIHAERKNVKVTDHLGLRTLDSGELVCVHGKYTIFSDGSVRETMLSANLRALADSYPMPVPNDGREAWGPEIWDSHVLPRARTYVDFLKKYYSAPGMERFQLAIMLGIASPFMAFVTGTYAGGSKLPINSSLTVSLYSNETARGKTSAAESAMLAYGRPAELTNDSGKAGATVNGRLGRLSLLGTMPSVMDETSDLSPVEVATTVSSVANGTGKQTMTANRVMRQESTWSLINIITTNRSQREMVAASRANAGPVLYRMLEIDVDKMPEYSRELRASWRDDQRELNRDAAGALGALVHREICAMGLDAMLRLVSKCVTKAEELVNADQSARFQSRALGAMLALNVVLQRLGLMPFELAPLVKEFRHAYNTNADFVTESAMPADPLGQLARALLDLAPHTIVTADEPSGRGFSRTVHPLNARMPEVIKARHIQDTGITYVSVDALREWCRENEVIERHLVVHAQRAGVLIPRSQVVNGQPGTRPSGPKVLTCGLAGSINLRCSAYTFHVKRLNRILHLESSGFDLIEGGEPTHVDEGAEVATG